MLATLTGAAERLRAKWTPDGGHDSEMVAGRPIHGRDGAMIGQLTEPSRRCRLDGFLSRRYGARWPDGTRENCPA